MVGEERKGVEADFFGEKRIQWIQLGREDQMGQGRINWDQKGSNCNKKDQIAKKRINL